LAADGLSPFCKTDSEAKCETAEPRPKSEMDVAKQAAVACVVGDVDDDGCCALTLTIMARAEARV
jgi:hypothetical protein